MTRQERITRLIRETTDRHKLQTLNRAWWAEYFVLQQAIEQAERRLAEALAESMRRDEAA